MSAKWLESLVFDSRDAPGWLSLGVLRPQFFVYLRSSEDKLVQPSKAEQEKFYGAKSLYLIRCRVEAEDRKP